jgi:hypothetical protein
MLVYQRMNPDASLEAAVKQLIDSKPSFLPDNKRVSEGTLSTNTSTYSQARSRLPSEATEWFANQVSQSMIAATTPTLKDRRVFVIDGTTIKFAPVTALRKRFLPASNQHGESAFPVALLTVAQELASGVALLPEVGAMYGENAISKTSLIRELLRQMPTDSVVMADIGFGIFAVAHEIKLAGHSFCLRLNKQRFEVLKRTATLVATGTDFKVWSHHWRPSENDRRGHPNLPKDATLEVRVHEITINKNLTLMLVASLAENSSVLADLYRRRGDVEVDIRNLKVVLDTENIRARSVAMFFKELLTSIVSHNLVSQFRCQAAELVNELPRRMSFKRIWTTFRQFLLSAMFTDAVQWRARYDTALRYAMLDKLPNRPGRTFEREAYRRTSKAIRFKRRIPKSLPEQ